MKTAWKSLVSSQPQLAFAVTVVFLAVMAVGLNVTVTKLKLHFKKQPVSLSVELGKYPSELGHWVQVSKDEPLNHEIQDALGTEKYIFRDYVDRRIVGEQAILEFKDQPSAKRRELLSKLQAAHPDAVVSLAVTYYTGMVDTVAHIPDRCYIADGYQPTEYTTPTWPAGVDEAGNPREIEVRYINFEDQTANSRITRNVAYFFHVNGQYECDPLGVRRSLQNLFQRYGYYSKIEMMSLLRDREESARVMGDFLASALPPIEKSLPDWNKITQAGVR